MSARRNRIHDWRELRLGPACRRPSQRGVGGAEWKKANRRADRKNCCTRNPNRPSPQEGQRKDLLCPLVLVWICLPSPSRQLPPRMHVSARTPVMVRGQRRRLGETFCGKEGAERAAFQMRRLGGEGEKKIRQRRGAASCVSDGVESWLTMHGDVCRRRWAGLRRVNWRGRAGGSLHCVCVSASTLAQELELCARLLGHARSRAYLFSIQHRSCRGSWTVYSFDRVPPYVGHVWRWMDLMWTVSSGRIVDTSM